MRKRMQVDNRYGNWIVLKLLKRQRVLCKCLLCNRDYEVRRDNLANGISTKCRSCGSIKYGHKRLLHLPVPIYHRLSQVARDAIIRATSDDPKYSVNYKDRGIGILVDWEEDYVLFVEYLATLPNHSDESLILDRINNDDGYVPGNLRFTTKSVSNKNRRPLRRSTDGKFAVSTRS